MLNPKGAGRLLGVSAKHVIRLIESRGLAAVNVGRGAQKPRYRIKRSAVEQFLESGRPPAAAPQPDAGLRGKPSLLAGMVDYFA